MTDEPVPPVELSDDDILKKAEDIKKARENERLEEIRKAEELKKAEEAKKAEELRKAEELKKAEEAKKAEEIKKARELVKEDDARIAEEQRKEEEAKRLAELEAEKKLKEEQKKDKPKKKHRGAKVFFAILIVLLILIAVTVLSANVTITQSTDVISYPYETKYEVWFPIGQEVSACGYKMTALSTGGEMMFAVGGVTYMLNSNEVVSISPTKATLTLFWGKLTALTVQIKVDLKYISNTPDNYAYMKMRIASDKQLPEFLINFFLPKEIKHRAASTF